MEGVIEADELPDHTGAVGPGLEEGSVGNKLVELAENGGAVGPALEVGLVGNGIVELTGKGGAVGPRFDVELVGKEIVVDAVELLGVRPVGPGIQVMLDKDVGRPVG